MIKVKKLAEMLPYIILCILLMLSVLGDMISFDTFILGIILVSIDINVTSIYHSTMRSK